MQCGIFAPSVTKHCFLSLNWWKFKGRRTLKEVGIFWAVCEGEGIHVKHRLFQAAATPTERSERAQRRALLTSITSIHS